MEKCQHLLRPVGENLRKLDLSPNDNRIRSGQNCRFLAEKGYVRLNAFRKSLTQPVPDLAVEYPQHGAVGKAEISSDRVVARTAHSNKYGIGTPFECYCELLTCAARCTVEEDRNGRARFIDRRDWGSFTAR